MRSLFARLLGSVAFGTVLLGVGVLPAAEAVDYRQIGHDHFFNLEYDLAIAAYQRLIEESPEDYRAYNHLATAVLYRELLRLGILETSAFKHDNEFLEWEKPKPDPKVGEEFERILLEGRTRAQAALKASPNGILARYALATNFGLHGNYQFMIKKSYFGALRNGVRANKHSRRILKRQPDFVDAYLVAGVHEYVVGSLPWAIRAVIVLGGIRGNKQKGEEFVTRVTREGNLARNESRALLALLLRRERRPLEAVALLRGMIRDFPRNYVLHLELASMYLDAKQPVHALEVFRDALAKAEANEDRFGRMPQRTKNALVRKIEEIEKELEEAGASVPAAATAAVKDPA